MIAIKLFLLTPAAVVMTIAAAPTIAETCEGDCDGDTKRCALSDAFVTAQMAFSSNISRLQGGA